MKLKIYGITKNEKKIVMFREHDDGRIITYDGKETKIMEYAKYKHDRWNYVVSKHKYFKYEKSACEEPQISMEDQHKEIIRIADTLKQETNGFINLYKSGEFPQTSLAIFERLCNVVPEPITADECLWLSFVMRGPLIAAEQYKGEIWKYDITSQYPSIMQDNHMLFPVKQGTFETIAEFGKDHSTAIYRCEIEYREGAHKLFKFNKEGPYYTSIDVRRARELKLKITLIQDGKPNLLYWDRSKCMTGAQLFRPFVKYMFDLKTRKVPKAKKIMNALWGALCHKQEFKKTFNIDDEILANEGNEVCSMKPYGDDQLIVTFRKKGSFYEFDWARICPFLLAKGRMILSRHIEPHVDYVVKTHTDSLWSTRKLDIPTGNGLGELHYEGYCPNVKIVNSSNIRHHFLQVDGFGEYMDEFIKQANETPMII